MELLECSEQHQYSACTTTGDLDKIKPYVRVRVYITTVT